MNAPKKTQNRKEKDIVNSLLHGNANRIYANNYTKENYLEVPKENKRPHKNKIQKEILFDEQKDMLEYNAQLKKENTLLQNALNQLKNEHAVCGVMYKKMKEITANEINHLKIQLSKIGSQNASNDTKRYKSESTIREQEIEMMKKELESQSRVYKQQLANYSERESILRSQVETLLNEYSECTNATQKDLIKPYQDKIQKLTEENAILLAQHKKKGHHKSHKNKVSLLY